MLRWSRPTLPVAASLACLMGANRGIAMAQPRSTRTVPISLKNKVVLITGATAGIGESCAWRFAEEGARLVLVGRRSERLKAIKYEIQASYPSVDIHTVVLSVADIESVAKLPEQLPVAFRDVEVIVNNAGLALGVTPVEENDVLSAKTVMDTNVVGIIAVCSAFLPGMKQRGSGHLINMGSIAGTYGYSAGTVYCASKYAVKGFTEAARHDLMGTPIRVTHISPGLVGNTEFSNVRLGDDKAKAPYADIVALHPDDVADNVFYAATRPAHVQVSEIMMFATNQAGPKDYARVGPSLGRK